MTRRKLRVNKNDWIKSTKKKAMNTKISTACRFCPPARPKPVVRDGLCAEHLRNREERLRTTASTLKFMLKGDSSVRAT